MIDAFATVPNYLQHLAPIWLALPEEERGAFWTAGSLADMPNVEGIPHRRVGYPPSGTQLTLVAGYMDEKAARHRPTVYVEHGAGQTYPGDPLAADHPAYNGTSDHDRTVLFLCPNAVVAKRWTDRYPSAYAAAVGCPKLDYWHQRILATGGVAPPAGDRKPTVAFTFHADNRIIPETMPAWKHYRFELPRILRTLRSQGYEVIGHGHPRLWSHLEPWWQSINVEPVADLGEVFARADLLCGDNTSALPEFASLGKPVLWMNAPWYRRGVNHGGRFWEWPQGQVSVDEPAELLDAIPLALRDTKGAREARRRMVASIYGACDGKATERAVTAILVVAQARAAGQRESP